MGRHGCRGRDGVPSAAGDGGTAGGDHRVARRGFPGLGDYVLWELDGLMRSEVTGIGG